MNSIGAFEAKNKLARLLDLVERGEEVTITRHGKEVARLVPVRLGVTHPDCRRIHPDCRAAGNPSVTKDVREPGARQLRHAGLDP